MTLMRWRGRETDQDVEKEKAGEMFRSGQDTGKAREGAHRLETTTTELVRQRESKPRRGGKRKVA